MNAIFSAFRQQADLSKCTLYTTHSPCDHCSKLIAQSGIKNVVYATKYHGSESVEELLGRFKEVDIR